MSRTLRIAVAALVLGASLGSPFFHSTEAIAIAAPLLDETDDAQPVKATNAGTLAGTVSKVDYQKSRITLATGHGPVDVTVLPSTTFQGGNDFSDLSDIVKGQRLSILLSQKGGEKIAQVIQLQK